MIQASSMRRRVAAALAALLVWLSPGPLCHEAVAAAFKAAPIIQAPISAAPAVRITPIAGLVPACRRSDPHLPFLSPPPWAALLPSGLSRHRA